jgi:hypothetical protein
VKLKNIYNFIAYSKIKIITIKSIGIICQVRKKLKGLFLNFTGAKIKEKKRRRRKKNCRWQITVNLEKHVVPPCKGHQYLPTATLEGGI